MNPKIQFILIMFVVFLLRVQALAEVNLATLVKMIEPAVVTIKTYDIERKILGQGSGFFISKRGYLITNYHVLKGAFIAEVKTYDGKIYPITLVVAANRTLDLIKIKVDIPDGPDKWLKVINKIPSVAERVLVIGSPMGLEQTVSDGIVSAIREIPNVGQLCQISAPISQGSSGSPVVNIKGEVIGVATFQFLKGQNLNFAVLGKYVINLKQYQNVKTLFEWVSINSKPDSSSVSKTPLTRRPLINGSYIFHLGSVSYTLIDPNRITIDGNMVFFDDREIIFKGKYSDNEEYSKQQINCVSRLIRHASSVTVTKHSTGEYILTYQQKGWRSPKPGSVRDVMVDLFCKLIRHGKHAFLEQLAEWHDSFYDRAIERGISILDP